MKSIIAALVAVAFAGLTQAPASAAPLSQTAGIGKTDVIQVQLRERRDFRDRDYRDRGYRGFRYDRRVYNWRGDRRYYRYRNWNRYGYRPYGWRSRGCVEVGPLWFCP